MLLTAISIGGIGPADQLEVVASSAKDGQTFIAKDQWINLPVGYNLIDHLNTDLILTHPDVVFYDFYEAWTTPNEGDKAAYLTNRTGILTQSAPNIGPMVCPPSPFFSFLYHGVFSTLTVIYRFGKRSPPRMERSVSSSGLLASRATRASRPP